MTNRENFIVLFSIAFEADIEKILSTKQKVGIGGGKDYTRFYQEIEKISHPHHMINAQYDELQCILKFFNDKCYDKIEFPKDYTFFFALQKFSESGYKPLERTKNFTKSAIEILGSEIFLETVFHYLEANKEEITDNENIFSKINSLSAYFILSAFDILYKKYKTLEPDLLKSKVTTLLCGRTYDMATLPIYKKLKILDKYIGASTFAAQFYEHNINNKKFIDVVDKFNIVSFHDKLKKTTEEKQFKKSSIKI